MVEGARLHGFLKPVYLVLPVIPTIYCFIDVPSRSRDLHRVFWWLTYSAPSLVTDSFSFRSIRSFRNSCYAPIWWLFLDQMHPPWLLQLGWQDKSLPLSCLMFCVVKDVTWCHCELSMIPPTFILLNFIAPITLGDWLQLNWVAHIMFSTIFSLFCAITDVFDY